MLLSPKNAKSFWSKASEERMDGFKRVVELTLGKGTHPDKENRVSIQVDLKEAPCGPLEISSLMKRLNKEIFYGAGWKISYLSNTIVRDGISYWTITLSPHIRRVRDTVS